MIQHRPLMKIHYQSQDAEVISKDMVVDILPDPEGPCNLESEDEGIGIIVNGFVAMALTWEEARNLSRALKVVEGVARCG